MAGAVGPFHIRGLTELVSTFDRFPRKVAAEVREGLTEAGEPVKERAEELAVSGIRNIGPVWSRMRIGVTTRVVYLAPRQRTRRGSPRPNLARLLLSRAMEPALEQEAPKVEERLEQLVDRLGREEGF